MEYFIKRENIPYYWTHPGEFLGGEDLFFAIKKTIEKIRKVRHLKRKKKQITEKNYDFDELSMSSDTDSDSLSDDIEHDETKACTLVFTKPIKAKSSVKATGSCLLLQLEKHHLNTMRNEFMNELKLFLTQSSIVMQEVFMKRASKIEQIAHNDQKHQQHMT